MQFKRSNIEYSGRDKYGIAGNGTKFRKKSSIYGNMTYAGGGGGIGPMPATGNTTGWTGPVVVDVDVLTPISNIPAAELTVSGYYVEVPINGFADNEGTQVWAGTLNGTATDNFGISGCTTGISVTQIIDNGTEEPKVRVKFTNELTQDSGELRIPVYVNHATYMQVWSATTEEWSTMVGKQKATPKVLTYCWNIKSAGGGSGYLLDLSNENASVNADVDGNIYSASTATLQCKATLYYNNIAATGVTYVASMPVGTIGVTIGSDGTLNFNTQTFAFTGLSTNITVTATKDDVTMTKVMRITKIKDSSSGGGVRRWIVPSVNVTVLSIDSSVTPSVVTATVMKQVSGNPPEVDNETTIFYGFSPGQLNPTITMPSTGVTIADTVEYLILALREGDVYSGTIYEQETIHMIAEGTGPTVRGPIMWRASLARRFSNGVGPQQQDRDFIDVVRYQAHSYKCINSYTQTAGSTWASVSENWQLDDSYNFVASDVDLEQNASIELRPGNDITFINANNTNTGYINNTTIMMGGTNPSTAPVYINNIGQARMQSVTANGVVHSPLFESDFVEGKTVKAIMTPFQMQMMICTDDKSTFDIDMDSGNWTFMEMDTEIPAAEFPYIIECDRETDPNHAGWWAASDSDIPGEGSVRYFGVVSSNVVRKPGIIYLNM